MSRLRYKAERIRALVDDHLSRFNIPRSSREPLYCDSVGYISITTDNPGELPYFEEIRAHMLHRDSYEKLRNTLFIHGDVGAYNERFTEEAIFVAPAGLKDLFLEEFHSTAEHLGVSEQFKEYDIDGQEAFLFEAMFHDYVECPQGFPNVHFV
ncbi:hypothetical protein [Devosia rhizoryzae]|uniref:Uncharacterized protein n=1 Tax=Devosia rhizoryzae TaxID=2774137 RepID=A0ABX7C6Z4_9HYPH|nr:hypothetical protein [Devosia rhizoryzae]QQR39029.1 hypothetical protein JI748_14995 [Devosia rhizoryzae]